MDSKLQNHSNVSSSRSMVTIALRTVALSSNVEDVEKRATTGTQLVQHRVLCAVAAFS